MLPCPLWSLTQELSFLWGLAQVPPDLRASSPLSKNKAPWTLGAFLAAPGFPRMGLGTPGHPLMYSWGLWDLSSFKRAVYVIQGNNVSTTIWYGGDKTLNYSSVLFVFTQIWSCQSPASRAKCSSDDSPKCRGLQNLFQSTLPVCPCSCPSEQEPGLLTSFSPHQGLCLGWLFFSRMPCPVFLLQNDDKHSE